MVALVATIHDFFGAADASGGRKRRGWSAFADHHGVGAIR